MGFLNRLGMNIYIEHEYVYIDISSCICCVFNVQLTFSTQKYDVVKFRYIFNDIATT